MEVITLTEAEIEFLKNRNSRCIFCDSINARYHSPYKMDGERWVTLHCLSCAQEVGLNISFPLAKNDV